MFFIRMLIFYLGLVFLNLIKSFDSHKRIVELYGRIRFLVEFLFFLHTFQSLMFDLFLNWLEGSQARVAFDSTYLFYFPLLRLLSLHSTFFIHSFSLPCFPLNYFNHFFFIISCLCDDVSQVNWSKDLLLFRTLLFFLFPGFESGLEQCVFTFSIVNWKLLLFASEAGHIH